MRIKKTDQRERLWSELQEATDENTTAGAIDIAVQFYLRMHGGNPVSPTGQVEALVEDAIATEGQLGAEAIADHLDCPEFPVEVTVEVERSYGRDA